MNNYVGVEKRWQQEEDLEHKFFDACTKLKQEIDTLEKHIAELEKQQKPGSNSPLNEL